jgi:hypothetical protein
MGENGQSGRVLKHNQRRDMTTSCMKLHGSQYHFHEVGGHSPPYGALKTSWRNVGWAAAHHDRYWTLTASGGAYMKLHCKSFFFDLTGRFFGRRLG